MCTQTSEQFEDVRFDIPTTEEEAFRILDEVYPIEGKKIALDETKDEFIINETLCCSRACRLAWHGEAYCRKDGAADGGRLPERL